jgi:glycosyltransferase involved in cell wall biosynthesis
MGHELLTMLREDVSFTVVAGDGLEKIDPSMRRIRVPIPASPAPVRIARFWHAAARVIQPGVGELVHTCGAVVNQPADITTVHLVQASAPASNAPTMARRVNSKIARHLGRRYESRAFTPTNSKQLVAVSDPVASELRTHFPHVPTMTIANGVDVARWESYDERDPHQPLTVGMVTNDFALKRVDLLIASLVHAPDVRAVVAGDGHADVYERLAASLGVADRVTFLGPVSDLRDFYRSIDVLASLSDYESFGLTMVEAALSGCALVARGVGVAPHLIGMGDGGGLVNDNPVHLGEVLARWALDRHHVQRAGSVARERARGFTREAMASAYLSLYRERSL